SVERIAAHIAAASRRKSRGAINVAAFHLDDVALATACIDDLPGAWTDLIAQHEGALVHAAEAYEGRVLAVISVRRFFIDLRRVNDHDEPSFLNLRRYAGGSALQTWLTNQMLAEAGLRPTRRGSKPGGASSTADRQEENRLRLALEMLRSERRRIEGVRKALTPPPAISDGELGIAEE
ncbi:MAG: hypothetical protein VYC34_00785, partial [Planctomycetota bacterium]|nr:hypothetical protein [Planctomycetota bacterium]